MTRGPQTDLDMSAFRRAAPLSRALVLFLAGALLWLFMAASQHHHETDAEDRDCAICTAVVHHVVNLSVAPTVAPPVATLMYFVAPAQAYRYAAAFSAICPPICGPPTPI